MNHHHHHSHDHNHNHNHNHHHHGHAHTHAPSSFKRLMLAFSLNLGFTLIELIGGIWTGSMAVLADAVHDLGDSMSLGLAAYFERQAGRRPTRDFSYGYRRLSLLSALICGVILVVGTVLILLHTIPRFWQPHVPEISGMIWLAALGIAVNGLAAYRLHGGGTLNERMLTWHLVEDLLGWIAVLVGALVMKWTAWYWVDPLLAVLICIFVGRQVVRNLRDVMLVFLQHAPVNFDQTNLIEILKREPQVVDIHDVHLWSLDGANHVLSLHVVVQDQLSDWSELKVRLRALIAQFGRFHTTLEFERASETCQQDCGKL